MSVFALKRKFSDINRLHTIISVIFETGGKVLVERLNLGYLVPLRCRIQTIIKPSEKEKCLIRLEENKAIVSPEVLREVLERLGPSFVKFGQVLSLRADLVGEEIARELTKLQSGVPPFPYEEVKVVIEKELNNSPENIFEMFDPEPIAAASLSQVHKAVMQDGTEVAVKVQRPGIRKTVQQDIDILFYLARLAEKYIPEIRLYQPVRVIKEYADWTLRELDFSTEGRNADRLRYAFRRNHKINIPKVYWEFTTPRVLVMDFVQGVKVDDIAGVEKLGVDLRELALAGVGAMFQQFFIDGFFHADPHPGNFFVLENGKLCLHDFGMVGYIDQRQRKELVGCLLAFVNKDYEGYVKHFLNLGIIDEDSDVTGFAKEISGILSGMFFSSKPLSMASVFFRIVNKSARYKIQFPADLALYAKAIITTEAMGFNIYPEFDFNRELEPFVRRAFLEYARKLTRSMKTDIADYLEFSRTLPEHAQKLVDKIEKGEVTFKIDTSDLIKIIMEINRQTNLRLLGTVLVAVSLGTVVLLHLEGKASIFNMPLSNIGLGLVAVLLTWFIYKLRRGPGV